MSLADAFFHFWEMGSRSDLQAKIDLFQAIRAKNLGKLISGKMTELRGGEPPKITYNTPVPDEALSDLGAEFYCELSRGIWMVSPSGSGAFNFEDLTLERELVLAVRPLPVAENIAKGAKRGPKGYRAEELKPLEVKFYWMLTDNDVQDGANISVDNYIEELIDWGRRNNRKTPGPTTMRPLVNEWWKYWLEMKSFNR